MLQRAWTAGRKCKATGRSYCQVPEKLTDSIGHTPAIRSLHIVSPKRASNIFHPARRHLYEQSLADCAFGVQVQGLDDRLDIGSRSYELHLAEAV